MKPIVYIVDDDEMLRSSLRFVLESAGYQVREFGDGESFLSRVPTYLPAPRCLLLDVGLPFQSGLEVQQELKQRGIRLPVVMISGDAQLRTAVAALREGAQDFLQKPIAPETLCELVSRMLRQDQQRLDEELQIDTFLKRLEMLTPRERQMLNLTVAGMNTKEACTRLGIGISTVLKHKSRMLEKLGVKNVVELAHLATLAGYPVKPEFEHGNRPSEDHERASGPQAALHPQQ